MIAGIGGLVTAVVGGAGSAGAGDSQSGKGPKADATPVLEVSISNKHRKVTGDGAYIVWDATYDAVGLDAPAREIDGTLVFTNRKGAVRYRMPVKIEETVKPGGHIRETGMQLAFDPTRSGQQWLVRAKDDEMKTRFVVTKIIPAENDSQGDGPHFEPDTRVLSLPADAVIAKTEDFSIRVGDLEESSRAVLQTTQRGIKGEQLDRLLHVVLKKFAAREGYDSYDEYLFAESKDSDEPRRELDRKVKASIAIRFDPNRWIQDQISDSEGQSADRVVVTCRGIQMTAQELSDALDLDHQVYLLTAYHKELVETERTAIDKILETEKPEAKVERSSNLQTRLTSSEKKLLEDHDFEYLIPRPKAPSLEELRGGGD